MLCMLIATGMPLNAALAYSTGLDDSNNTASTASMSDGSLSSYDEHNANSDNAQSNSNYYDTSTGAINNDALPTGNVSDGATLNGANGSSNMSHDADNMNVPLNTNNNDNDNSSSESDSKNTSNEYSKPAPTGKPSANLLLNSIELQRYTVLTAGAEGEASASSGVHISALDVSKMVTGTSPFDNNDSAGNDSSPDNLVCRTFDTVSYTLGYVVSLDDTSVQVSSSVLYASFTLNEDPHSAQFDESGMAWAENTETTYTYEDGTASTSWDKTKTVVKQTLTARRTLAGKSSDDRVPGAGQLSVTVKVLNAPNGHEITPEFSLRCEGSDIIKTVKSDPVTASSKLKLDLRYEYGATESARNPLYLDEANSTWSILDNNPDSTVKSRVYANSIGVCLYNDSASKGMKGLALPSGPITFDIKNTCDLNGADVTHGSDYRYLLWDYRDDNARYSRSDSAYKRTVDLISSQWSWEKALPLNNGNPIGNDSRHACYHGGHFTIQPDTDDSALLHVTLDGYEFDYDNWSFPKTHGPSNYTSTDFGANELYFSVLDIQSAAVYPRSVESTMNYMLKSHLENLKASTQSGDSTQSMMRANWRKDQNNKVVLYQPGSFVSRTYWYCHNEATTWGTGRCYAGIGERPSNTNSMSYDGTENVRALDHLFKFDTQALDLTNCGLRDTGQHGEKIGSKTMLYAAKPDGTGWTDWREQRSAKIKNLVYYKSLDDLKAAGKVCVGILAEYRDTNMLSFRDWSPIWSNFRVRSDATPGYVAISTNCTAVWNKEGEENPGSVLDHPNGDGSYGLVRSDTGKDEYEEYSSKPSVMQEFADYEPSRYENGTMVGGHTNGVNHGDSLLIVGDKTSVQMSISDRNETGSEAKSVYDLDAGERTVSLTVEPKVQMLSSDSSGSHTDTTDDITVTVTIPKGLSYVTGSSSTAPDSIDEKADGSTVLTYKYDGWRISDSIPPIALQAYIGNPGAEDDAKNNQEFTLSSKISSTGDPSASVDANDPHKATASFRVVRLAALSVSKRVSREHSNPNEPYTWTLRISNTSDTEAANMAIADLLPYNGDRRGTSILGEPPRITSITLNASNAPGTLSSMRQLESALTIVDGADETFTSIISHRPANGALSVETLDANSIKHGSISSYALASATTISDSNGDGAPDSYTYNMSWSTGDGIGAYIALGSLQPHEYVDVEISMEYPDGGEASKSRYVNQFIENSDTQPDIVTSNSAAHDVLELSVPIKKVWMDAGSQRRPDSLPLTLHGDDGSSKSISLSADSEWSTTMKLPAYSASGELITWSLTEDWTSDFYNPGTVDGDQTNGFTITNKSRSVIMPFTGGNMMILVALLTSAVSSITIAMLVRERRERQAENQ